MLDFMRRNANSWIMVLLFGIIIFVFAINFGPWAGNVAPSVPYAAVVNNEPITLTEFRTAYASQFARIKQFRPDYDQTEADRDGLKQIVIEQLISRELLTQMGRKHNLSIGALTLAEEIKLRVFGEEAAFNKEEYIRRVNSFFQSSITQFEAQVEKELVAEQMANLLGTAIYISDSEAKLAYLDKNTKIALEFVKVSPAFFSVAKVNPEVVKTFADANSDKISAYYNEHISDYVKDEEIRASHILVKIPPGISADEKKTLKEKADNLLARIKGGEDFAAVAKKESEDTGTKESGGDLNFFSLGMMVEEFSKPAFALKKDEVSGVVESNFGYHIIKKTDERPKLERKLDDVKIEIAETLVKKEEQDQKAKEYAANALEQLKSGTPIASVSLPGLVNKKSSTKTDTESLAPVADDTDPFTRASGYIYKIGRAEKIGDEANKLTMENKTANEVIEANGDFFAIRLKSREEADLKSFEAQKESLKMSLMYPRRRAFMQQYLSNLKAGSKITYNDALLGAASADS